MSQQSPAHSHLFNPNDLQRRRTASIPAPVVPFPIREDLPEGFPRGQRCDPKAELPVAPNNDNKKDDNDNDNNDNDITGRLIDECPSTSGGMPGASCKGLYVADLQCDYNYIYTGCTAETLACVPVVQCRCDDNFGDGTWACLSMALAPCDPETQNKDDEGAANLVGRRCDPKQALPVPPFQDDNNTNNNADVALARDAFLGGVP
mmetsp:Transcript_19059/g.44088  ORF Transcript_19059/g.44088 Transcript_19059/m.44088 type:complete len:205 (-) Transcript_19059:66-680(-)